MVSEKPGEPPKAVKPGLEALIRGVLAHIAVVPGVFNTPHVGRLEYWLVLRSKRTD